MIYLDNSATTIKKPPGVMEAVVSFSGNPGRGGHELSLNGAKKVYACRENLCQLFSAPSPEQVIFVKNGTEALNLAILGVLEQSDHVVFTSMEHNSVVRPIVENGFSYTIATADPDGFVDKARVEEALQENTKLLVITHASNVCGSIQPIYELAKLAHQKGIKVLIDAAQSAGVIPLHMEEGVFDFVAFSGHKGLMGPLGTGALILGNDVSLKPLTFGGTGSNSEEMRQPYFLPDRYESGTLNGCGIAGLAVSTDYLLQVGVEAVEAKKTELVQCLIDGLLNIPQIILYGSTDARKRADAVSFNVKNRDCNLFASYLEERYGLYGRSGLHCAPLAHKTIGSFEQGGALRLSPSFYSTREEIDRALSVISKTVKAFI